MAGSPKSVIALDRQQQYRGIAYLRKARERVSADDSIPPVCRDDDGWNTKSRITALYDECYDGVLRRPTWTAVGTLLGLRPDMCYSNTSSVLRPALVTALYAPDRTRAVFRKAKDLQPVFFADCRYLCEQSTEFENRLSEQTQKNDARLAVPTAKKAKIICDDDDDQDMDNDLGDIDDDELDDVLVDMIEDAMTNDFDWNAA